MSNNKLPQDIVAAYKEVLTSSISVRLSIETKERIQLIAKENGLTVSATITMAIDSFLIGLDTASH